MKHAEYSHKLVLVFFFLWLGLGASAQEFMNGNFENNSGTPNTDYFYLPVPQFETMVPNCYSSGSTPNIDLISSFGLLVPQGEDWFLGLTPQDVLILELTEDLIPGAAYTITFYDRSKEIAYPIDIGVSQNPHNFGDWVYTTPQAPSVNVWSERTFVFVAPNNGRYISVRPQLGSDSRAWAGVDYFVIDSFNCELEADAGPDRVLCPGQSLQLTAAGSAFDTYEWNNQSTAQTLTVTQPGSYWFIGTQGVCSDADTVLVSAAEIPEALFEADLTEGCAPLSATFTYTGQAQPGQTYTWTMDDGSTHTGTSVTHVYTQELCHDVSLSVTNVQGCTATHTRAQYICVNPAPVASFIHVPELVFVDNPQVQFMNTSTAHAASEWQLGDGTTSTEENPQHTYALNEGGDYMVRLIIVSDLGCTDTVWNTVTIRFRFNMFVPNAFTPDGDSYNPVFTPIVTAPFDVEEYLLQIYDRWGTEQFSSTALPQGWDGTLKNKPIPGGIYTWKITIRDPYTKRQIVKTGQVTLIR